jgi:hypothetical protein
MVITRNRHWQSLGHWTKPQLKIQNKTGEQEKRLNKKVDYTAREVNLQTI